MSLATSIYLGRRKLTKEIISASLDKALSKSTLGAVVCIDFSDGTSVVLSSFDDRKDINWNSSEKGTCQMACTQERFVEMLEGRLAPPMAFMNGQTKITGDMGIAMKMAQMIGR